ncbi:hypothetical protein FQR65_LT05902 [Abscondita terminalis]|nr:hypothetical protein FQR65_LT05902 [Abscondita terminalis]
MSESTKVNKAIVKLKKHVPIVSWLPQYTKFDGISDLISGITVGLTIMPQSMAYASLANLPPHYGLYSSFMGAFMYVMFGTIKEASVGPTSLMALLTLSYTNGLPIEFVILLSFLGGWVQLVMGIFKLGFLVDFISTPAISGFTSATSFTIILAQMKGLFGIRFTSDNVFHYIQKFYSRIPKIRYYDLILGCCCIAVLLIFRSLNNIKCKNTVVKKTLWFLSIGRNALIVLVCSILAYYLESKLGKSPFTLYGKVPAGIPSMQMPQFSTHIGNQTVTFVEMVQKLGTGIVVIPVVSVLSNVAVAKAFTSGKRVDSAQEMVTLGICNIMGSFVQSMPVCGAFTRSAVANASGVRTPFAGIYAGTIILLALSFLTPYFYYIPKSTLAAVLISAVIFMIDIKILPKLWKTNKYDLFVMFSTFIVSLIFSVEQGLLVGVIVNFIPMIKLWTRPKIDFAIKTTREGQTYLLVKPELGLYYSASEYFTLQARKTISSIEFGVPVVFDFRNILYVDYTSTQSLTYLLAELQKDGRSFLFMNLSETLSSTLSDLISEYRIRCCEKDDDIFETLLGVSIDIEDDIEAKLLPPKQLK